MKKADHERILAEQVIVDAAERDRMQEQLAADMRAFKSDIVEQAARENAALRNENAVLRNEIAALKGKLVHVIDNPSPAKFVSGSGR